MVNFLYIPDIVNCNTSAISFVATTIRCSLPQRVAKLIHVADKSEGILGERSLTLGIWCDDVCLSSPLVLMVILELFYDPGNIWPDNHPTPQSVEFSVRPTAPPCVILFMCLIDWDRREHICHLPYSKGASPKFAVYIWMFYCKRNHLLQVNRNSPDIVCVV